MSYFELMGFGPKGWGWPMLMAAGMTVAVASCGFLVGAILGSLIAWAKLSRSLILRSLGDGYTTVLRGIPDLLVIYLFYFGGSAVLSRVGQWFGGRAGSSACRPSRSARSPSASSRAPIRPRCSAAPITALARGEIEAAKSVGMHRIAAVPPHHRAAGSALRDARASAMSGSWRSRNSSLISVTGLTELLRQSQIGAGSTHQPSPSISRRRCSISSSPASRPGSFQTRRGPLDARRRRAA